MIASNETRAALERASLLLLAQPSARLKVRVTELDCGFDIHFASLGDYQKATGVSCFDLYCGALSDGCTLLSKGAYYVFYNERSVLPGRLQFTLAHELGHILLGHSDDSPSRESAADAFAAQVLAPSCVARELIEKHRFTKRDISEAFGISSAAAGVAVSCSASRLSTRYDIALIKKYAPAIEAYISSKKEFASRNAVKSSL